MHLFLKEILAVDNVRLGDQASFFVAFPERGASRCSLIFTDNEQGLACLWQVALNSHRSQRNMALFR